MDTKNERDLAAKLERVKAELEFKREVGEFSLFIRPGGVSSPENTHRIEWWSQPPGHACYVHPPGEAPLPQAYPETFG